MPECRLRYFDNVILSVTKDVPDRPTYALVNFFIIQSENLLIVVFSVSFSKLIATENYILTKNDQLATFCDIFL